MSCDDEDNNYFVPNWIAGIVVEIGAFERKIDDACCYLMGCSVPFLSMMMRRKPRMRQSFF